LEDRLGLPFDKIDFRWGDSDGLTMGSGTGGAKTLMLAGGALFDVADKIIAKGKLLAGHVLEAASSDIAFNDGVFSIVGTDRRIDIMDLAAKARSMGDLPEDVPSRLDDIGKSTTNANTFPNGAHIVEVEIDPDTGSTRVVKYTVIDDFGLVLNPMIVKGQAHGGIAQGIGQALLEDAVFDPESGQMLAGSFTDYAMPHADNMPRFDLDFNNTPCTTNVMGIKGAGEAGSVGALAAVMNAVNDALRPAGVSHMDMPATPRKVWEALSAARG
jgi:carbon-monoxide dehydrogenase large subunit